MKITIKVTENEIADLVLGLQSRQNSTEKPENNEEIVYPDIEKMVESAILRRESATSDINSMVNGGENNE